MNKMTIKGIIMAGGEGKRFRPLTYYFQKCMIPVGTEEKPILEYIIRLFSYYGIKNLIVLSGYKSQQISNYFNKGDRFGVKIEYLLDKPNKKGSANALLNAYYNNYINKQDTLVIYYGDILSNMNLAKLVTSHEKNEALVTVALSTGFSLNVGIADIEGIWIKEFKEKPIIETPVSIGILVLSGKVIDDMVKLSMDGQSESFDLMGDVIPYLVNKGEKVAGYITDTFWYDVGSLERYERLNNGEIFEFLSFLF
jgi:mannose-1-phosphate guanylyltransferase